MSEMVGCGNSAAIVSSRPGPPAGSASNCCRDRADNRAAACRRVRPGAATSPLETLGALRYFIPAAFFAAAACCFFWAAALALTCFCAACLCTDFGDLSPIMTLPFCASELPRGVEQPACTDDHNQDWTARQAPIGGASLLASRIMVSVSVLSKPI